MHRSRTFSYGLGTTFSANKGVTKALVAVYCNEIGGAGSDSAVCCRGVPGTASYCASGYGPVDPAHKYVTLEITKQGYAKIVGVSGTGKKAYLSSEFRLPGVSDPIETCTSKCFSKNCGDKPFHADECRAECVKACTKKPEPPITQGQPQPDATQTAQASFLDLYRTPILLGLGLSVVVLLVGKK